MALRVDICKKLNHFTLKTQFEASEGVTGILGASGCGKSMTLRCIAGIEKPDEGYIELNGKVFYDSKNKINLRPQERHVGLLFQNYALFPNMTVEQNLMAGLLSGEKDRTKARTKVREMLARFELTGLEKHRPSQLSGGQQQRVALARIFLSEPDIMMLDQGRRREESHRHHGAGSARSHRRDRLLRYRHCRQFSPGGRHHRRDRGLAARGGVHQAHSPRDVRRRKLVASGLRQHRRARVHVYVWTRRITTFPTLL